MKDALAKNDPINPRDIEPPKLWKAAACGGAIGACGVLWFESETLLLPKPFKYAAITGAVCAGISVLAIAAIRFKVAYSQNHREAAISRRNGTSHQLS